MDITQARQETHRVASAECTVVAVVAVTRVQAVRAHRVPSVLSGLEQPAHSLRPMLPARRARHKFKTCQLYILACFLFYLRGLRAVFLLVSGYE